MPVSSFELATTVKEARAKLHDARFQAAVVDLRLPDEPGDSLVEDVRRVQPDLPIVIETGVTADELRWRNIRAALICVAVVGGALLYSLGLQRLFAPAKFTGPYAALVRIEGLIDAEQRANAHKVNSALRSAFEDPRAKGVVLLINSPGGSPVQASLIHDRLLSLRARYPRKAVWLSARTC